MRQVHKWPNGIAASFTNWKSGHPNGGKVVVMKMRGNLGNGKWETKNYNSHHT